MSTRKLGVRRTMTPNQIVAYNVAKARALRGWTQEQAADALAPYLGAKLSGPSFSGLERSAWTVNRIKQFSADDLLALSRGFDLPIGFFFTPPPPDFDAGLYAPDAGIKGLDPIVLLDAILGTPDNLEHWDGSCSRTPPAPHPRPAASARSPACLHPISLSGSRRSPDNAHAALLRRSFGDIDEARDVLERLTELIDTLDDTAQDGIANKRHEPAGSASVKGGKGREQRAQQLGTIDRLPSGRWRVRLADSTTGRRVSIGTWEHRRDAERALAAASSDQDRGAWVAPEGGRITLAEYAPGWLASRLTSRGEALRPRVRELYECYLRLHIVPTLGAVPLGRLTTATVRGWYVGLLADGPGPSTVAKCYRLLRAVLNTAVEDRLLVANPCTVKGAGVEPCEERSISDHCGGARARRRRFSVLPRAGVVGGLRRAAARRTVRAPRGATSICCTAR